MTRATLELSLEFANARFRCATSFGFDTTRFGFDTTRFGFDTTRFGFDAARFLIGE